jgi:hypothetical protein
VSLLFDWLFTLPDNKRRSMVTSDFINGMLIIIASLS